MTLATSGSDEDFMELTARENAVMRRVLVGQSNKQIARTLNIAEHTVKIHLYHAYGKLRIHSRVELLLHYRRGADSISSWSRC
jgi:two-component system nitrate/nitrite response regulator NarL